MVFQTFKSQKSTPYPKLSQACIAATATAFAFNWEFGNYYLKSIKRRQRNGERSVPLISCLYRGRSQIPISQRADDAAAKRQHPGPGSVFRPNRHNGLGKLVKAPTRCSTTHQLTSYYRG